MTGDVHVEEPYVERQLSTRGQKATTRQRRAVRVTVRHTDLGSYIDQWPAERRCFGKGAYTGGHLCNVYVLDCVLWRRVGRRADGSTRSVGLRVRSRVWGQERATTGGGFWRWFFGGIQNCATIRFFLSFYLFYFSYLILLISDKRPDAGRMGVMIGCARGRGREWTWPLIPPELLRR